MPVSFIDKHSPLVYIDFGPLTNFDMYLAQIWYKLNILKYTSTLFKSQEIARFERYFDIYPIISHSFKSCWHNVVFKFPGQPHSTVLSDGLTGTAVKKEQTRGKFY